MNLIESGYFDGANCLAIVHLRLEHCASDFRAGPGGGAFGFRSEQTPSTSIEVN